MLTIGKILILDEYNTREKMESHQSWYRNQYDKMLSTWDTVIAGLLIFINLIQTLNIPFLHGQLCKHY